ncbi:MAG: helix-turn-helix domain-containing protein [Cognaticolwellia sp.]
MNVKLKVNLDLLLLQRKMSLTELSAQVDVTIANLSKLKCGRAKAIRFSTLLKICQALECQPGDLLAIDKAE